MFADIERAADSCAQAHRLAHALPLGIVGIAGLRAAHVGGD